MAFEAMILNWKFRNKYGSGRLFKDIKDDFMIFFEHEDELIEKLKEKFPDEDKDFRIGLNSYVEMEIRMSDGYQRQEIGRYRLMLEDHIGWVLCRGKKTYEYDPSETRDKLEY